MRRRPAARLAALLGLALAAGAPGRAQEPPGRVDPPPVDTLTLREAITTALGRHPDVRGARADASAERAARWSDWGAFLPTADVSASFSRSSFTNFSFALPEGRAEVRDEPVAGERLGASRTLGVRWTLLEGGRRFAELAAGAEDVRAAEARLSAAERAVAAGVKEAFYEAVMRRQLAGIARRQLENRRREHRHARERFRIAAIDRSDLLGARGQVRRAEVRLLDAREAAGRARRELAVRMGEPDRVGRPFALAEPPEPPPDAPEDEAVVAGVLASHPELQSLEAEVAAAASRLTGERTGYLPTLTLSFSTSRSESLGPGGDFFNLDPRNRSQGLSLVARWRVFTGFDRKERNARRSASVDRRRAERAGRRLEIERTVRDLAAEIRRRGRRLELLKRRLEVARERLRISGERFRAGSGGYVELQQAVRDLSTAERSTVRERFDRLKAWARLERWTGELREGVGAG